VVYVGSGRRREDLGSFDGFLYALDAETGEELWRFYLSGGVTSSPVVTDGVIYVGARGGLHAVTGGE
jgi:outer membrane protein assembly factor BamB